MHLPTLWRGYDSFFVNVLFYILKCFNPMRLKWIGTFSNCKTKHLHLPNFFKNLEGLKFVFLAMNQDQSNTLDLKWRAKNG
jgi:hypothetical protein